MKRKSVKRFLAVLCALTLATGLLCTAAAEAPRGDGNGILSRALMASLYNWLGQMDPDFRAQMSFESISNAVGKWGCVKETGSEDTAAAYWTDGQDYVTVTFRNKDGFWGVTSITTDLPKEEYEAADISFLPRVGNREAGSSPVAEQTLSVKMKDGSEEVSVTAQVPTEYWYGKVSFGEVRLLNAVDESRVSGNSNGLRLSFWSSREAIEADQAKGENLTETEPLYLLDQIMPGCTYTRSGMQMQDYIAELAEDLWMRVSAYRTDVYIGSEAEAMIKSLTVQKGDFTWHWEPLGLGWDDGDDEGDDWMGGDFSLDTLMNSDAVAQGILVPQTLESGSLLFASSYDAEDLAFSHEGESENYYSYTDFDILVLDPETEQQLPILRLWIMLRTQEKPLNISSVTFTAGGREYTFTDVSEEEDTEALEEGGYSQTILIRFDQESLFMLTQMGMDLLLGGDPVPMVLHGDEDLRVELDEHFREPFRAIWTAYVDCDAESNLSSYKGNPVESRLSEP